MYFLQIPLVVICAFLFVTNLLLFCTLGACGLFPAAVILVRTDPTEVHDDQRVCEDLCKSYFSYFIFCWLFYTVYYILSKLLNGKILKFEDIPWIFMTLSRGIREKRFDYRLHSQWLIDSSKTRKFKGNRMQFDGEIFAPSGQLIMKIIRHLE